MNIIQRVACKAVIVNDSKVLILREAGTYKDGTQTGRWHMAGGRIDAGEKFKKGLKREIKEETGLVNVEIGKPIFVGEWFPDIHGQKHQIIAIFFLCSTDVTDVKLSEEHDSFEWIEPHQRKSFDLMDPEWEVIDAAAKELGLQTA